MTEWEIRASCDYFTQNRLTESTRGWITEKNGRFSSFSYQKWNFFCCCFPIEIGAFDVNYSRL